MTPPKRRAAGGRSHPAGKKPVPARASSPRKAPLPTPPPAPSAMAIEGHPGEAPTTPAFWHLPENLLLTFFFAVMMVLPLLDILARKLHGLFDWFPAVLVSGSLNLVQHSVLAIMMFGGAIAAREGKLLQLATTASMIPQRFKAAAHILTAGIGAAITLYLVKAGFSFAMIERDVDSIIALGIPKWTVLMFLPVGFAMILVRMIWRSSDKWNERLMTLMVAGWLAYLAPLIHNPSMTFIYVCFGLLMVAVVFGMPVFLVLGGAALIFLWNSDTPIDSIPAETYRMVVSPTIPTIPLFTLTGYFLAEGGASARLLRVFQAFFGLLRGGPAIVTACVCAFFTAFTGGSGVTILALGGLLMPILLAEKYKERNALGLLTSAGSLGMLFPPSLPVILYGVVSGTSIKDLFLGGFMPGMILLLLTAFWGVLKAPKEGIAKYSFWRTSKLWSGIGLLVLFFGVLVVLGWRFFSHLAWMVLGAIGKISPDNATVGPITFVQLSALGLVLVLVSVLYPLVKKHVLDPLAAKMEVQKETTEALVSAWEAKWELSLPLVVFFFLFVIKVTLVESAALTALYAFLVEVFFYRQMKLRDVPKVITECGILVGGVLLILGVSLGFTNDMVDAEVPARLAAWVHDTVHTQWVFLLMVNLMLIVVGSLLEIFAAIVVVVPLLMPMSDAFGVDRVHMGIIFLANMELGFIAPPLGLNLFLSSYRFKKPMTEVYLAVLPMYVILHGMVLLITFWPFLTTWLPRLLSQ
ncbi:MAG TPA: TRAP transporter large permease subunit [bacterium]|jgi:TRAP-type C4-dicarboxylate transport system permease large subunit/TRAP-type C4-dicarboxylate transport system permease small subunit|nr:TRAP transporter large permease subunit [bacterium]